MCDRDSLSSRRNVRYIWREEERLGKVIRINGISTLDV